MLKQFTFNFNEDGSVVEHYESDGGNIDQLWKMPDSQLNGMAHVAVEILSKKNNGKFDYANSFAEKVYYYMQRIARYMTDPEYGSFEGFMHILKDTSDNDEEEVNTKLDALWDALKVIDDIVNF